MTRVGMDIGGTQLRVAAFADDGTIQYKAAIANNHMLGPRENLDRLIATLQGWGVEYAGIGIGCPGPLDFGAGTILTPPNLPGWENFAIRDYVRKQTGHQVALNNDANVAGLAEALVGAGKGYDSVSTSRSPRAWAVPTCTRGRSWEGRTPARPRCSTSW